MKLFNPYMKAVNIFLQPGQVFRVVLPDEPLKPHFLVREMYEGPMFSESGGWDTTFKESGWKGTAWHKVEDELPAWIDKSYNDLRGGGKTSHFNYEIIEIIDL